MEKLNFDQLLQELRAKSPSSEEVEKEIERRNESMLLDSLTAQGIPKRIIAVLESDLKLTKAVRRSLEFFRAPREAWVLVLSGDKGCGKSVAAGAYLQQRALSALTSDLTLPETKVWWSAVKLTRMSSFNGDFESLLNTSMLVLDDLGVEYLDKGGHFQQRFDELMNDRYENFGRTIITTNLNAADFKKRYSERVTSRMREGFHHGGGFIEIPDGSMR